MVCPPLIICFSLFLRVNITFFFYASKGQTVFFKLLGQLRISNLNRSGAFCSVLMLWLCKVPHFTIMASGMPNSKNVISLCAYAKLYKCANQAYKHIP